MPNYFDIDSIAAVHRFYRYGVPKHPLITVVDLAYINPDRPSDQMVSYHTPLYVIMCKRFEGAMKYGRSHYDFDRGSLMFTAPHQVISTTADVRVLEGWGLFFHPDLLLGSALGRKIHEYSFFHYDVNEALHISDAEKEMLMDCLSKIEHEYSQNFDRHTNNLILDNLQLLLSYCTRFYDRQFLTRSKDSHDVVQKFERLLTDYFSAESLIDRGLPDVKYFASHLHLSASYLSDLLSKYTGKTTLEHIHLQVVDKAKSLLLGSEKTVSEIAYALGFEHPSHFTKIFKAKTGLPPKDFRGLN
jgi:AraC family transcriptional regulator, transcriptional activator of pobA